METLITLTLFALALATLGRAVYVQVTVLRSMAWPYADEAVPSRTAKPPAGTSMARASFFMRDASHGPLRRSWAASWIWALVAFFALLVWITV